MPLQRIIERALFSGLFGALFIKILTLEKSAQSKKVILGKLTPLTEAPILPEVFSEVSPMLNKGVVLGGLVKSLDT